MIQRAQTIALAVVLLAVVVIFALVSSSGVSTRVFSADPTPVPPTPSATPVPVASADNWTESGGNQLSYADSSVEVSVDYGEAPLVQFLQQNGLTPVAEGAPYPLLDAMQQIKAVFDEQVSTLTVAPDSVKVEGPALELLGDTGLAAVNLRYIIQPATLPNGSTFDGADIAFTLIDHGDGQITYSRYQLAGVSNPVVYADYRAWLVKRAGEIAAAAAEATAEPEATAEAGSEATGTPAAEGTGTPAPEATGEAAATEAAPTAAPTEVPPAGATPTPGS